MMEEYVLIIWLAIGRGAGLEAETFRSKNSCDEALEKFIEEWSGVPNIAGGICVKK